MNKALTKITAAMSLPTRSPLQGLSDDAAKSPKLNIEPTDWRQPAPLPKPFETDVVDEAEADFKQAMIAREVKENVWYRSMAMERGNQYVEWDTSSRLLKSVLVGDDKNYFKVDNEIRPLILKNTTRATQNDPDISFKPRTLSQQDRDWAHEARIVRQHASELFNRKQQTRLSAFAAQITSTVFMFVGWDPTAKVWMPSFGDDPATGRKIITGGELAAVGELEERLRLPFQIFLDPQATTFDECRYLYDVDIRPLSWLRARYGDAARYCEPDAGKESYSYNFEQRIASITGDTGRDLDQHMKSETCTRIRKWELPSDKFEQGRLITIAGGKLLTYTAMPYAGPRRDYSMLPYAPLMFQSDLHTPWGRNLVQDMFDVQGGLNNAFSHMLARCRSDKLHLLLAEGCDVDWSDVASPGDYSPLIYSLENPTMPKPEWMITPADYSKYLEVMTYCKNTMQDMSGVHDPSQGKTLPGVHSGVALQALQNSDNSQVAEFASHIEEYDRRVAEWEVALYAQFASEPRLMGLDDDDFPAKPQGQMDPAAAQAQMLGSMAGQGPTPMPGPTPGIGQIPGSPAGGVPPTPMAGPNGPGPSPGGPGPLPYVGDPFRQAVEFKGLRGGQGRVTVKAGSALPTSPEAEQAQLDEWLKMGLLGAPGSPQTFQIYAKLSQSLKSDELTDQVVALLAQAQAANPTPEQIAQQQQIQQQQMAQAEQAHQAQMIAAKEQSDIAILQAKYEMEAKNQAQLEQLKGYYELQVAQINAQARATLQEAGHDHEASMIHVAQNAPVVPSVSFAAKLDPTAQKSAEDAAGYESGSIAEITKANAPAPVAAGAGKPGASKPKPAGA